MNADLLALFNVLLPIMLPILFCVAIGYGWGRYRQPFPDEFVTTISTNIAAPCLVFGTLAQLEITPEAFGEMALAAALAYLSFAILGYLILWPTNWSIRTYLPALMFGNIGNMGLPLCLFAFGDAGLALALGYFCVGIVALFIICPWMASGQTSPMILLRMPLIYAVIAALPIMIFDWHPPLWLANTTDIIGGMMIPLMLLALGHSLGRLQVKSLSRSFALSLARLTMGLFVGVGLAELLQMEEIARGVLIIQTTLPVAVFNYLFAARYGREPQEVASIVIVSTVISFLTLPLLLLMVLE